MPAEITEADREQAEDVAERSRYRGQLVLAKNVAQALADQREALEQGYRVGYATLLDVRGMVDTWLGSTLLDDDRETLNRIAARLGLT